MADIVQPPAPGRRRGRRMGSSRRKKKELSLSSSTPDLTAAVDASASAALPDRSPPRRKEGAGIFRSFSERRRRRNKEREEALANGTLDDTAAAVRTKSTRRSLKSLSFRRKKEKRTESGGALIANPNPDAPTYSPKPSRPGFFRKRDKGHKEALAVIKKADSNSSLEKFGHRSASRSEFFKSKKGPHLWAERYGVADVSLATIELEKLLAGEQAALGAYAIEQLSLMLAHPVVLSDGKKRKHKSFFFLKTTKDFHPGSKAYQPRKGSDPSKVFGIPLEQLLLADQKKLGSSSLRVPVVVASTTAFLNEHAIRVSGIFRVSGSARRIRQINEQFDSGNYPDLSSLPPNDVASVLKYFLRNLPEPLLTWPLYQPFMDTLNLDSAEERLLALRLLVALLPPANRGVLEILLDLFSRIASVAEGPEGNLMNSHNLAVVLAPNILKTPSSPSGKASKASGSSAKGDPAYGFDQDSEEGLRVSQENGACDVVELLIEFNEHLFVVPADLRDAVLLHHQVTDQTVVSTVLRELLAAQGPRKGKGTEASPTTGESPTTGAPSKGKAKQQPAVVQQVEDSQPSSDPGGRSPLASSFPPPAYTDAMITMGMARAASAHQPPPAAPSGASSSPAVPAPGRAQGQQQPLKHPARQRPKPTFSPASVGSSAASALSAPSSGASSHNALTAAAAAAAAVTVPLQSEPRGGRVSHARGSGGFRVPEPLGLSPTAAATGGGAAPLGRAGSNRESDDTTDDATDDEGHVGSGDLTAVLDKAGLGNLDDRMLSSLLGEASSPLSDLDHVWDKRVNRTSPRPTRRPMPAQAQARAQPQAQAPAPAVQAQSALRRKTSFGHPINDASVSQYQSEPASPRRRRESWNQIRTAQRETQAKVGRLSSHAVLLIEPPPHEPGFEQSITEGDYEDSDDDDDLGTCV